MSFAVNAVSSGAPLLVQAVPLSLNDNAAATDGLVPVEGLPAGPNNIQIRASTADPLIPLSGNAEQQEANQDEIVSQSMLLVAYLIEAGGTDIPGLDSSAAITDHLSGLQPNTIIEGEPVVQTVYTSTIPNATPREAFEHFVNNTADVFQAGGLTFVPPLNGPLTSGRYMIMDAGPPPTPLPVEITVDHENMTISIQTLEGHGLRGLQTFSFTDNGQGGTTLTQDAQYQLSTELPAELQSVIPISDEQHEGWYHAHLEIYYQFNGDPAYEDVSPLNPANVTTGEYVVESLDRLGKFFGDPATVARVAGTLGDSGLDMLARIFTFAKPLGYVGDGLDWALDHLGWAIDEAGEIKDEAGRIVIDAAGNVADWAGDRWDDVKDVWPF